MARKPHGGSTAQVPDESVFAHITHLKKRLFLEAYAACGSVRHAAHIAQSAASQNAFWLHTDPAYAEAFCRGAQALRARAGR